MSTVSTMNQSQVALFSRRDGDTEWSVRKLFRPAEYKNLDRLNAAVSEERLGWLAVEPKTQFTVGVTWEWPKPNSPMKSSFSV